MRARDPQTGSGQDPSAPHFVLSALWAAERSRPSAAPAGALLAGVLPEPPRRKALRPGARDAPRRCPATCIPAAVRAASAPRTTGVGDLCPRGGWEVSACVPGHGGWRLGGQCVSPGTGGKGSCWNWSLGLWTSEPSPDFTPVVTLISSQEDLSCQMDSTGTDGLGWDPPPSHRSYHSPRFLPHHKETVKVDVVGRL